MRKKKKITVAFSILLSGFFFSQSVLSQSQIEAPEYTDYCKLVESESADSAKTFRTKAFMTYSTVNRIDGGNSFFYLPKCNGMDNFAVADFSVFKDVDKKWSSFFNNLPREKNLIFEVDFTGTRESSIIPLYGHLSWSRSEIKIAEIKSIKNISRSAKKPHSETKSFLVNQGNSLRDTNSSLLFSILGNKYDPDFYQNIAETFVLTDFAGNTFTKKTLPDFFSQNPFRKRENYPSSSIGNGEAVRIDNRYKITGIATFTDNQNKTQKLRYENLFEYKNENWFLTKSNLSIL